MDIRFGLRHICAQCGKNSTYHKIAERRAFACSQCGYHIYPCAGTILHDSHTSLQTWFYAIYLFVVTRHGVSGKEMQRALGVTYKTAWRIGHQIRKLMEKADGFEVLKGHVEADEAFIRWRRLMAPAAVAAMTTRLLCSGIKERGGRIHAEAIPDVKKVTLRAMSTKLS